MKLISELLQLLKFQVELFFRWDLPRLEERIYFWLRLWNGKPIGDIWNPPCFHFNFIFEYVHSKCGKSKDLQPIR
jgi:hypothetical protein